MFNRSFPTYQVCFLSHAVIILVAFSSSVLSALDQTTIVPPSNMAIFKATHRAPTAINPGVNSQVDEATAVDAEKDVTLQQESAAGNVRADPALEKRVVRKLDYHVTPLVTFLCKSVLNFKSRGVPRSCSLLDSNCATSFWASWNFTSYSSQARLQPKLTSCSSSVISGSVKYW